MQATKPKGVCPVCNGTCRVPVPAEAQRYKTVCASYDAATDTFACSNCGGQYMFGSPTGQVSLNHSGKPCTHSYKGVNAGRCLTSYTCEHCGDKYDIDSSD